MMYFNGNISHAYLGSTKLQNIFFKNSSLLARQPLYHALPWYLKSASTIYVDQIQSAPVTTTEFGKVNAYFYENGEPTNKLTCSVDDDVAGNYFINTPVNEKYNTANQSNSRIVYGIKKYSNDPDYLHVDYKRYNTSNEADATGTRMKFTTKIGSYWAIEDDAVGQDVFVNINNLNSGTSSSNNLYLYSQWAKNLRDTDIQNQLGDDAQNRTQWLANPELRAGWSEDSIYHAFEPVLYIYGELPSTFTAPPDDWEPSTPEPEYGYIPLDSLELTGISKDGFCYLFEYNEKMEELYQDCKGEDIYIKLDNEYIQVEIERFVDTGTIQESTDDNTYFWDYVEDTDGIVYPYPGDTLTPDTDNKLQYTAELGLLNQYGPGRLSRQITLEISITNSAGELYKGIGSAKALVNFAECVAKNNYAVVVQQPNGAGWRPADSYDDPYTYFNYETIPETFTFTIATDSVANPYETTYCTSLNRLRVQAVMTYLKGYEATKNELAIADRKSVEIDSKVVEKKFIINGQYQTEEFEFDWSDYGWERAWYDEGPSDYIWHLNGDTAYNAIKISLEISNLASCDIAITDVWYYYQYTLAKDSTEATTISCETVVSAPPTLIYFSNIRPEDNTKDVEVSITTTTFKQSYKYEINTSYTPSKTALPLNAISKTVYDYFDLTKNKHVQRCEVTDSGGLLELSEAVETPLDTPVYVGTDGIEYNWAATGLAIDRQIDKYLILNNNRPGGIMYSDRPITESGLYDANNKLVASMETLVKTYKMDYSKNYTAINYSSSETSPYYVLTNNSELSNGVKLILNNTAKIGEYAFYGCTGLTSVTIGGGVSSIGNYAFQSCSGLTSIEIQESVTSIGSGAFNGCSSLESITIPFVGAGKDGTNNTYFGYIFGASSYSSNKYHVPANLKTVVITCGKDIGDGAFYGCTGLRSITIPGSVSSIGSSAFDGCTGLTAVHIADLAAWCGISFYIATSNPLYHAKNLYLNGSLITDLVIPNSVTEISSCAFYNCTSLTSVTIPSSVTSIGSNAFHGCTGLTSIVIPESVTSLERNVFRDCTNLSTICCEAADMPYGWDAQWRDGCEASVEFGYKLNS